MACAGRPDTKITSQITVPQKVPMPFISYSTIEQVYLKQHALLELKNLFFFSNFQLQRQISNDNVHSNQRRKPQHETVQVNRQKIQVIRIHAGGHQTFIRTSYQVCHIV